jgi:hypothetical protein
MPENRRDLVREHALQGLHTQLNNCFIGEIFYFIHSGSSEVRHEYKAFSALTLALQITGNE